ncbi:MAG: hypothetical protein GEV11_07505 [Streptosporangiales bacterium]|nr:hypothetical protein [Streptosporangiales bacterium]
MLVAAVLSCAAVGPILVMLGPILVGLLRDTLHLGCTGQPAAAGETAWVCPDGITYLFPGVLLAAALAGTVFCVATVRIVRSVSGRAPKGEVRRAAARDLAWLGAAPLVLQAPFSVVAGLSDAYSSSALVLGLIVGLANLGPFLTLNRPPLFVTCCAVAAAAGLLVLGRAVLLTPLIAGCVILLLSAIVVGHFGEERARDDRAPASTG